MKKISILLFALIISYSCTKSENEDIKEELSSSIEAKGEHLCALYGLGQNEAYQAFLKEKTAKSGGLEKNQSSSKNNSVITIKVVINHIGDFYNDTPISQAQALDIVAKLNSNFSKQNPNRTHIYSNYTSLEGTPNITFVYDSRVILHRSTGSTPTFNTESYSIIRNNIQSYAGGGITPKDPTRYLNIYMLNDATGAPGHGINQFAANYFNIEECVIFRTDFYYGTDVGAKDKLTHEAGHYFNLSHIFSESETGTCANGDFPINDTPWQEGPKWEDCGDPRVGCEPNKPYMRSNFMSYSHCMSMFTLQQVDRMRNSVLVDRPNLNH